MNIKINNLPPMPRNRSHMIARNMLIKTPLAREFEKDLFFRLKEFEMDALEFKSKFNPKTNYLKVIYYLYTPENELFKKDGGISLHSVDADAHKIFQDVLAKSIGIDDKFFKDVSYQTRVSSDGNWNYLVNFEIQENECLYV